LEDDPFPLRDGQVSMANCFSGMPLQAEDFPVAKNPRFHEGILLIILAGLGGSILLFIYKGSPGSHPSLTKAN